MRVSGHPQYFQRGEVLMSSERKVNQVTNSAAEPRKGLTVRSMIVALLFVAIFGSYNLWAYQTGLTPPFEISFFPNNAALLGVVLLMVIGRYLKRFKFEPHELGIVYSINAMAQVIMVAGMYMNVGNIAALNALSLQNSRVFRPIFEIFPDWLILKDQTAGIDFWVGGKSSVPWGVWIKPLIVWGIFWLMVFGIMLSLAVIVREQWLERERLTFPLVTPIIETINMRGLTKDGIPFYKNRIFWAGTIYPIILIGSGMISRIIPAIPALPGVVDLSPFFTEKPWVNLTLWPGFEAHLSPMMIGIGYLINAQAAFSIWFFYLLLNRFGLVFAEMTVGTPHGWPPIFRSASRGMFVGVTLVLLWLCRDRVAAIVKKGLGIKGLSTDDSDEAMSYKAAFWMGIVCFVCVSVFSIYVLQVQPVAFFFFFITALLVSLGFARLRAETGYSQAFPPTEGLVEDMMIGFGRQYMGTVSSYSLVNFFNPLSSGLNGGALTLMLEMFKVGEETKMKRKSITWAIIIALVFILVLTYMVTLKISYKYGVFKLSYHFNYHATLNKVEQPDSLHMPEQLFLPTLVGVLIGAVLMWLQAHIIWWPFLPLGVAISAASTVMFVWAAFFIAWLFKVLMMRYGGPSLVAKFRPFALGLILGHMGMGVLNTLVGIIEVLV